MLIYISLIGFVLFLLFGFVIFVIDRVMLVSEFESVFCVIYFVV